MNIHQVERNRLQGWLYAANAVENESLDQLEWSRKYCILDKDERKLSFFNDTESVLMPQSQVRFGYADNPDGCISPQKKTGSNSTLNILDAGFNNFQRGTRQTRSFRDKVKSSLTKGVKKTSKPEIGSSVQGGSVRVSRSRSFGKTDRIDQNLSSLKFGHSLENLHRVCSHGTTDYRFISLGEHGTSLDLSMKGPLSILPVHQSVSPRHSCFRIVTDNDILIVSCGSQEEQEKWLSNLNNCSRPNRNHLRRLDTMLTLWVMEARNLQPKKKYYCEIYLNRIIYAQTCLKSMNDILFWGESFIFNNLPPLGSVMIKIYRDNYNKKKKEKASSTELGRVEIPTLILESGNVHEKWHPVVMQPSSKGSSAANRERERDPPSIRFKIHYHVISILPLKVYDDFLKYLGKNYSVVCELLEPVLAAKAKDEIAQTLVYILQVCGKAKDFLCDIIMAEVLNTENENLIFRGNTFATKAVDTYMKMVGETYLHESLSPFIQSLLYAEEDIEVDPSRTQPGANLQHNKEALVKLVKKAWNDILSSYTKFPSDLQNTLHSIRQKFGPEREDACFKFISGSIFLRFFCPAILSPSLFHLCQEYPDEKTSRKLTLVAKVLQNLANFARFGVKEEYMCFMNDFVSVEIKNMKEFIKKISSPNPESHPVVEWKAHHIDLGREASIMHLALSTQLKALKLSQDVKQSITPLTTMLDDITRAGEEDEGDPLTSTIEALRVMQTTVTKLGRHTISGDNVSGDNSDSSSEYTTPAQSQATSPSHDQSPPPPGFSAQMAHATIKTAAQLMAAETAGKVSVTGGGETSQQQHSPSTSPTHGEKVSRLATHSHSIHTQQERSISGAMERVNHPRRTKSDPERQRHRVRPASQQLPGSTLPDQSRNIHSYSSIGFSINNCADTMDVSSMRTEIARLLQTNAQLQHDNVQLQHDMELLQRKLEYLGEDSSKENDRLRKLEEAKRQADHDLHHVKESRGKVFRGLNMQTEIVKVQVKRDFDNLKKQLQIKDDIIIHHERKIAGLVEEICTLRHGFQVLNSLPKHDSSDSDLDEEESKMSSLHHSSSALLNGHTHAIHTNASFPGPLPNYASRDDPANLNPDLLQVISQLDSGKFDD